MLTFASAFRVFSWAPTGATTLGVFGAYGCSTNSSPQTGTPDDSGPTQTLVVPKTEAGAPPATLPPQDDAAVACMSQFGLKNAQCTECARSKCCAELNALWERAFAGRIWTVPAGVPCAG